MKRTLNKLVRAILIVSVCPAMMASAAQATPQNNATSEQPDVVIVQRPGGDAVRRIEGKILDWTGGSLTLGAGSRERRIDNELIVDVQTRWSDLAIRGQSLLASHDFGPASALLRQAIETESREWAKTMLRADLVRTLLAAEQPGPAVEQFFEILRVDPTTRLLNVAPMAWTGNTGAMGLIGKMTERLSDENPIVQLIAASWLVGSPREEAALETLDRLSRDLDERLARLAAAQIWRTRRNVKPIQLKAWRDQVVALPLALQAGPTCVLAQHYLAVGEHQTATTMWMRLPILHADRPDLAAASLYQAARALHNAGRSEEAAAVANELATQFVESRWHQQLPSVTPR